MNEHHLPLRPIFLLDNPLALVLADDVTGFGPPTEELEQGTLSLFKVFYALLASLRVGLSKDQT